MKTVLYCIAFAFIMVLNSCDSNSPTSLSEKTNIQDSTTQQIPQTAAPQLPTANPVSMAADIGKTKPSKVKSKTNSLNLSAETQKFTLKNTRDTTIFGANGTRIFIPASCFVTKNRKRIKGSTQVVLKECYRPEQMIKERLSTLCGNQLLASEGMIHIEAYANQQKLQLKKGKSLVVHFPKRKKEFADMGIFYGKTNQEGNVVWKKESGRLLGYELRLASIWAWQGWNTQLSHFNIIDFGEYILKKHNLNKEDLRTLSNRKEGFEVRLAFDKQRLTGIKVVEQNPIIRQKIINISEIYIPKYNKNIYKELTSNYSSHIYHKMNSNDPQVDTIGMYFRVTPATTSYQSNTNYKTSFQQKYKNSDISDIDEAELNYYIFNANELGWINCDRFYKSTAKKIDYIVQTDSVFDGQVSLIFKDFRGVLIGEKTEKGYVFKNIPVNERIDIVAMKSSEKGILFAMKQTTTSEKPYRDLAFKPLKVADLDKEIENLL